MTPKIEKISSRSQCLSGLCAQLDAIETLREMTDTTQQFADSVAQTYGSRAMRSGREYRVFCPVHEADGGHHSPSLAIWPRPHGHPGLTCMTGCSWREVVGTLRQKGIVLPGVSREEAARERELAEDQAADALRRAKALYAASAPIVEGDAAQRYLAKRHLWPLLTGEDTYLRVTRGRDAGEWLFMSVIVDLMSLADVDQRAVGCQILPIDVAGNWKTQAQSRKKMRRVIGRRRACGVPLGKPGATCVVGEGVETTMAAMRLLEESFGVASLSADNLVNLTLPAFIRTVVIAQDNDPAGLKAATEAAPLWRKQGIVVRVASFGETGNDACDLWERRNT